MIAAQEPIQRPRDAKLLVVNGDGAIAHAPRSALPSFVQRGDIIVANDAATLPASLFGTHEPTGEAVEIRLAGWGAHRLGDPTRFVAVVFGSGDYRTRTENRPPPPDLVIGDRLMLGPLRATIVDVQSSRLVTLHFAGTPESIWAGLAQHGRPIQYAHMSAPLALWDVWTPFAGAPAAFEPPSAGFTLDWQMQCALRARGADIATLTHAAGISASGDGALDARLPLPELYAIPARTVAAIGKARGRVIAVGTSVVRALEHAALRGELRAGPGVADQRIDATTRLRVIDVLLTGTHESGTSHFDLLRAFASDSVLAKATATLDREGYRTHEFGDSMLVTKQAQRARIGPRVEAEITV